MLVNTLKPAVRTKRTGRLSEGVLLVHDNAHPHTAAHTAQTFQPLRFEVLEHAAYSPDLAPSDYHLFGPLKDALRDRRFSSNQQVKAVDLWLRNKTPLLQMVSESLCNGGSGALKTKVTMLKMI